MDEQTRAERDVEAFIQILEEKHGIKLDDLKRALHFHVVLDRRAELVTNTIIRIIITALLALLGYAIYEAIVAFIEAIEHVNG